MKGYLPDTLRTLKKIAVGKIRTTLLPDGFYFSKKGHCPCCQNQVRFQATNPWLRDYFLCSNCRSIPRERALMLTIEKYFPNWKGLSIHESSPVNRGVSKRLKENAINYVASQYYPEKKLGTLVDGFRNQDLENQTFPDESFDLVISQDVMEHVYNPGKAFSEISRTLKKGGAHIFTVPLVNKHRKTEAWALKGDDGGPVFLKEPEWHGNPVDAKGSPVTMHWGYDITDFIFDNSALTTTIEYTYDLFHGISAEFNEVLVSKKNNTP